MLNHYYINTYQIYPQYGSTDSVTVTTCSLISNSAEIVKGKHPSHDQHSLTVFTVITDTFSSSEFSQWSKGKGPPLWTSALDGHECPVSYPRFFTPGERVPNTHCTGNSKASRASLYAVNLTLLMIWYWKRLINFSNHFSTNKFFFFFF
jgi:hypothetical protein